MVMVVMLLIASMNAMMMRGGALLLSSYLALIPPSLSTHVSMHGCIYFVHVSVSCMLCWQEYTRGGCTVALGRGGNQGQEGMQ